MQGMQWSPYAIELQVTGKHLLQHGDEPFFPLRPDIGVRLRHNDQVVCLLDTKWKLLDWSPSSKEASFKRVKVSPADMYQMYAYGNQYDAPTTVLLYPGFKNSTEHVKHKEEYQHCRRVANDEESPKRRIVVCTVNLKRDLGKWAERQALRKELADLVACAIECHSASVLKIAAAHCSGDS